MRRHILLFINGNQHRVAGSEAFMMLSDFLRQKLGLSGTKVVCSEGDCGSCSVLCGRLANPKLAAEPTVQYAAIDSCIQLMFQLDGCHIITVEGLANEGKFTPVQQAMVDCHGSQCGFCTPGFVVTMTGMLENEPRPCSIDWQRGLSGNLCRCTGYAPIIEAGRRSSECSTKPLNQRFPPATMMEAVQRCESEPVQIESLANAGTESQSVYIPTTLNDAVKYLAENPAARIITGGTDIGVQINKRKLNSHTWLDLNRVDELKTVEIGEKRIAVGARTTWSTLEEITKLTIPPFHKIISLFGSPQIRTVGTIGGNIINASPIADSLPFLYVSDAQLELTCQSGTRTVNINQFYTGYKQIDLQPGEILNRVIIPLPGDCNDLKLYKVSRRRDLDISTFTAAISIDRDGDVITSAAIAYGAVGPIVLRLPRTEQFLHGRVLNLETMKLAGDIAVEEITPISDVRGGSEYRFQLARNVLQRYFYETCHGEPVA